MSRATRVISLIKSSVSGFREFSKLSTNMAIDDIDLVDGMPVGLQIVGGRFGEEKCVSVAKAIEQAMRWSYTRSSL